MRLAPSITAMRLRHVGFLLLAGAMTTGCDSEGPTVAAVPKFVAEGSWGGEGATLAVLGTSWRLLPTSSCFDLRGSTPIRVDSAGGFRTQAEYHPNRWPLPPLTADVFGTRPRGLARLRRVLLAAAPVTCGHAAP